MDKEIEETVALPYVHETPPNPKQIGPYLIERFLVRGGMSLIYLGTHPGNSLAIAIKVIQPKYLKNSEVIARFLKEANILKISNHPGIVSFYDLGKWEQGLFLAMEFVQGIGLREFIKTGAFTRKQAIEIAQQIGNALAYLHAQGIVHRDLKPDNILITPSGQIKLIDFGISQFLNHPAENAPLRAGTPGYMSPEQKEHPEQISPTSDLYSLGLILYELYLGKLSHGIIYPALLPTPLRNIVEKTLQFDPKDRYQTADELLSDLAAFITD